MGKEDLRISCIFMDSSCNVPDPLTGEEDATNTKHMGKYPHEHGQEYNAEIKILNIIHTKIPFIYIEKANIHSFKNSTCSPTSKYKCKCRIVNNTHLIRTHPVTSYVAATFHTTIGQCAHQYLRKTATPKLGMIPQGIRVETGLHIAKVHKSTKPT